MSRIDDLKAQVQLAREVGDVDAELAALEALDAEQQAQPIGTIPAIGGALDIAKDVASTAAGNVAGGLAGLPAMTFGAMYRATGEESRGTDLVNEAEMVRKAFADTIRMPVQSQAGQQVLQNVAESPIGQAATQIGDWYEGNVSRTAEQMPTPGSQAAYQTLGEGGPQVLELLLGLKSAELATKGAGMTYDMAKKGTEAYIKHIAGEPDLSIYADESMTSYTPEAISIIEGLYDQKLIQNPKVADQAAQMAEQGRPQVEIDNFLQKALGMPEVLTPGQMEIVNLFARTGVTPSRAFVTQSTEDFKNLMEMTKGSNPASERIALNQIEMADAAERARQMTGGTSEAADRVGTSNRLFKVIDGTVQKYDDAVSEAYRQARELTPIGKNIKPVKFGSALRRSMAKAPLTSAGGVPQTVRNLAKEFGWLQGDSMNITARADVQAIEKFRQELNRIYAETKPDEGAAREIIHDLKEALDEDVMAIVGEDVFKDARQAKIDFHKLIERDKQKRDRSKSSLVEDIVYQKVDPGKIFDKIPSARYEDKIKLRKFLVEDAGDEGKAVWNDMRAQIIEDAITKATGHQGKAEGGVKVFKGKAFRDHIEAAIGGKDDARSRNLFYSPEEWKLIDDIAAVYEKMTPPNNVRLGYGPSSQGMEQLIDMISPLETGKTKFLVGALLNRSVRRKALKQTEVPLRPTAEAAQMEAYRRRQ